MEPVSTSGFTDSRKAGKRKRTQKARNTPELSKLKVNAKPTKAKAARGSKSKAKSAKRPLWKAKVDGFLETAGKGVVLLGALATLGITLKKLIQDKRNG